MIDTLAQAKSGIVRELDDLDRAVMTLRGQWSGEARAAYDQAHAQWSHELGRMAYILGEAESFATHAAEKHRAIEAEVVGLW